MIELKIGEAQRVTGFLDWSLQLATIYANFWSGILWPCTVILVVFWFRDPISHLIKSVKRASVGSASVEVESALSIGEEEAAKAKVEEFANAADDKETDAQRDPLTAANETVEPELENGTSHSNDGPTPEIPDWVLAGLNDESDRFTASAVMDFSWRAVRGAIDDAYLKHVKDDRKGIFAERNKFLLRKALKLYQQGLLSHSSYNIFREMLRIRLKLKSSEEVVVTLSEAYRFRNLSQVITTDLRRRLDVHVREG